MNKDKKIYQGLVDHYSGKVWNADGFQRAIYIESNINELLLEIIHPYIIEHRYQFPLGEFDGQINIDEMNIVYDILSNELTSYKIDSIKKRMLSSDDINEYNYIIIGLNYKSSHLKAFEQLHNNVVLFDYSGLIELHKILKEEDYKDDEEYKKYFKKNIFNKLFNRSNILDEEKVTKIYNERNLEFQNIYSLLEENASSYRYSHQIGDLFNPLIEKFREENNPLYEKIAHNEREAFYFHIIEGKLNPTMTWNTSEGEIRYPDLKKWDENSYEYIINRLNSSTNPVTRARYAHILWESPHKHGKYAQIAVDAYLELVDIYRKKDIEEPDNLHGLSVVDSIKNAFYLARNSNDQARLQKIKEKIKDLINSYERESKSAFALRRFLLELMIDERSFNIQDIKGMDDVSYKIYVELKKGNNSHQAIMMLETGKIISNKIGEYKYNWNKLIAEEYEILMNNNAESNSLAAIHFYEKSYEYYKMINDEKKLQELNDIYNDLRKKAKYTEFKTEIDMTTYKQFLNELSIKIKDMSFKNIIQILSMDEGIIPKYNEVEKEAKDILKNNPLSAILPRILIDERGHTAERFYSDETQLEYQVAQQYRLHIEMLKGHLINTILIESIKNKIFTYDDLLTFLADNSWIGMGLTRKIGPSLEITYKWLDVISPALKAYFNEVNSFLSEGAEHNFVLTIDSLVLKIEGLIREICQLSGITTFYHRETPEGKVIREKDLHALLYEDKVKELFSKDELYFMKFILVEQVGYNLRHKIAHSLIISQEYTISLMNLLIVILLRISRFQISIHKKEN